MMEVMERQQTKLNKSNLKGLMLGVYEKVENESIQTDRQIIDEVMEQLRPIIQPIEE